MTLRIPLSVAGSQEAFAATVQAHRDALEAHMMGPPGKASPVSSAGVQAVIERRPQDGPVAKRGPDEFVILPYAIFDDTPRTAEQQQAIDTLRATIK